MQGNDAWNDWCRARRALRPDDAQTHREDAVYTREALQRIRASVRRTAARDLARQPGPLGESAQTVVLAHHDPWFRDATCALLSQHGFQVVEQTDDGADALGARIAGQPDLVLAGGRLAVLSSTELMSRTALFAPLSVRLSTVRLHVSDAARST